MELFKTCMIAGKSPSLSTFFFVALVLLHGGKSYSQDGFLGKVFKGKKTSEAPANPNPAQTAPSNKSDVSGSSQNAFRAVSSNGKIIDQAPGTAAPPRRITPAKPSEAKPGQYAPVPSSALGVSALDRPPKGAAEAARPYPQKPVVSAAGKYGKKSNGAYRPVSSDGTIATGAVSNKPSAMKAPIAPPTPVSSAPKPNDWTQKRQDSLPPIPTLYAPAAGPAPTSQKVPPAPVAPMAAPKRLPFPVQDQSVPSAVASARLAQPTEFAADPRAEAEVQRILSESPSTGRSVQPSSSGNMLPSAPRKIVAPAVAQTPPSAPRKAVSPIGSQKVAQSPESPVRVTHYPTPAAPRTMADGGAQGNSGYGASAQVAAAIPAPGSSEFVGQVTPTQDLEDVSSTMQRFPAIELPDTRKSLAEQNVDWLIDQVASAYSDSLGAINGQDVSLNVGNLPDVPSDFGAEWGKQVRAKVWQKYGTVNKTLQSTYASALQYSHQVKAFSSIPLIRETGIQEAQGAFDWTSFLEGRYSHTDEPTSSILTTGEIGRFEQDLWEGEYGVRKRLKTGAQVSVSNRLSTLDNNSEFLQPNPQTGSELVLSISQPLLQGNGYHYNTTSIKVAKLDAKLGAAEYLRQLESYMLEVNRTYWGVYLARAGYLQRRSLVSRTKSIVTELEDRKGVDAEATASELLRAKSSLAQRQASLVRSEMSIRLAEERLRALVNDPNFSLGSTKELVPTTAPILSAPSEDVREVAKSAIQNRPELLQGFYQVQAAGLRRDLQKNELMPTLNLILEGTVAGLGAGRDLNGAFEDQFQHGEGWLAGFTFEMPLERNFAKARHDRRRHELNQQLNTLRGTVDSVALEAIVAYRELQTSYRDMQAKYLAATATREELKALEERLDVDAGGKGGTVGYQLQLILDAIDRNQRSEEQFLVSVVVYNTAFTTLDKARGTLLRRNDIQIQRGTENGLGTISTQIGADGKSSGSYSK